jgi:hypothetical protein
MGASGWAYYTPYRDDPRLALRELQQRVFSSRDYGIPLLRGTFLGWFLDFRRRRARSIDELLELSAEAGTHSILDITDVGPRPARGRAWPLSDRDVAKIFGTATPTRADIDPRRGELSSSVDRGQGVYLVVYRDGQPHELYFEGKSGD